jgi:predicted rRNA methylase YqxC with S4 and FtsJ domains
VLLEVLAFANSLEFGIRGLIRSPLKGPKGNTEFLVYLVYPREPESPLETLVEGVMGGDL